MLDVQIYGSVEEGLTELEADFPNIRADFERLLTLLHSRPFSPGQRLDPNDPQLQHVSWTNVHHTGGGAGGRGAAVLIYEVWRDMNAIHLQLLGLLPGTLWKSLTWEEEKEEARKLVSPA